MKYSNINRPIACMLTNSSCYKETNVMTIKGVLLHSTGINNPNLRKYIQPSDDAKDFEDWIKLLGKNIAKNDWNHTERKNGVNCWIGKMADGCVASVQTLPWNYRAWGCGSGDKGTCNNGWIQIEICEDRLNNKDYFDKVYEEACELIAYLCKMYYIDPMKNIEVNGVQVPTVLCHCEASELGFAYNQSDINHWFSKFEKTMDDVRHDVAILMGKIAPEEPKEKELYYVRKTWEDIESQLGIFEEFEEAKKICEQEYEVYNNKGIAIYPEASVVVEEEIKEEIVETGFKIGDAVQLTLEAVYASGQRIPKWMYTSKLYVRKIENNGDIAVSTRNVGAITGVVKNGSLEKYTGKFAIQKSAAIVKQQETEPTFESYVVAITEPETNVRKGPGNGYKITDTLKRHRMFTIVEEKNGWGKLKIGTGWINLNHTKKL